MRKAAWCIVCIRAPIYFQSKACCSLGIPRTSRQESLPTSDLLPRTLGLCVSLQVWPGCIPWCLRGKPWACCVRATSSQSGAMLYYNGSILMSCLRRWVGVGGYIIFLIIGTATIPQLYPPAKW